MQSIDKDHFLWMLEISAALKLDPTFFLNLCGSSVFIVPLFIASSIWVSNNQSFKIRKVLCKKIFVVYRQ